MIEIEHWQTTWGELTEQQLRARLQAQGYQVSCYHYPPGTHFPDHSHSFAKKDAVVSGQFLIRALGRDFLLTAGDMLVIPAGLTHSATVIGNQTVISLDASKY